MRKSELDARVMTRTILLSAVLLAGIFIGLFFLEGKLTQLFGKQVDNVQTGIMLFALWLIVSSGIRSIDRLRRNIAAWKLILAGFLITFIGVIFYTAFLILYPQIAKTGDLGEVADATKGLIIFFSSISLFLAIITVINLRIRNRLFGNILEVLLIVGGIYLLLQII